MNSLVSCLMVTKAEDDLFEMSVQCFSEQTHKQKELIVVFDRPSAKRLIHAKKYLSSLKGHTIRCFVSRKRRTLGELRNLSVSKARGVYVCQWDSDDYSHPRRIEWQLELLKKQGASLVLIQRYLHYFVDLNVGFLCDLRSHAQPGLPGTILAARNEMQAYRVRRKHEDGLLIDELNKDRKIVSFRKAPDIYVYFYHGRNAHSFDHHWSVANKLSVGITELQKNLVRLRRLLNGMDRIPPATSFGYKGGLIKANPIR